MQAIPQSDPTDARRQSGICNSCNLGMRDFPDMYAQGPRAYVHIRQTASAHVICNTPGTLKICPNLMSIFLPPYIRSNGYS